MTKDTVARLKKINWFADLPEDMLTALSGKISERSIDKDEVLFNKGDVGDSLFVILEGQVKVVTNDEDGNEIALNNLILSRVLLASWRLKKHPP